MFNCGIDIGGLSSHVCIMNSAGEKKFDKEVDTNAAELTRGLKPYLKQGLKIAIEAGNQTRWIYNHLVSLGAEVTVVNPGKMKGIAESRCKTDKLDAEFLCEMVRLGGVRWTVHVPSEKCYELRLLLGARRRLLNMRTRLCNGVRGVLKQDGIRLPARGLNVLGTWDELIAAQPAGSCRRVLLEANVTSFKALTQSVRELEKKLKLLAAEDERVALLRSMPLVGLIASLTLLGALDDAARFGSSRKVGSYAGLVPWLRKSSDRAHYGSITREGRRELREVWVQIAQLVARSDRAEAQPLRAWFEKVALNRGKKRALVGLARKLLTVAYQILKHKKPYDARQVGRPSGKSGRRREARAAIGVEGELSKRSL